MWAALRSRKAPLKLGVDEQPTAKRMTLAATRTTHNL
jgi:hypothetical protein